MECPECAYRVPAPGSPQKVQMKEFLMGYRCPKCGYEIRKSQVGSLNVSGSVVGDYGRTSVDMVCPNCDKVVAMKVTTAHLICPECGYKTPRWRQPSQTITLSERDVARVLQAIATVEGWKIGRDITSNHMAYGLAKWDHTPEGWPVPSRRLMEEIKKLL